MLTYCLKLYLIFKDLFKDKKKFLDLDEEKEQELLDKFMDNKLIVKYLIPDEKLKKDNQKKIKKKL